MLKRRIRTVIQLCEQCGNDFYKGKFIEKEDGRKYIQCPYCGYHNKRVYRKKKNKEREVSDHE